MSPPTKRLECAVIGAGIAGLAAATALRRAGHNVEVFEKSTFRRELGAAITLTPNANLVLDSWGLDPEKAQHTLKLQSRTVNQQTLATLLHLDLTGVGEKYGHNFNCYHRVDLHNALRDMAFSPDQPGPVPLLNLGHGITAIDCEKGEITMASGKTVRKDLVVIANGIRTEFHELVVGGSVNSTFTKKGYYRALVPVQELMDDDRIRPLLENEPSGFIIAPDLAHGINNFIACMWRRSALALYHLARMLTSFHTDPCRDDQIMNLGIGGDRRLNEEDADEWDMPVSRRRV